MGKPVDRADVLAREVESPYTGSNKKQATLKYYGCMPGLHCQKSISTSLHNMTCSSLT